MRQLLRAKTISVLFLAATFVAAAEVVLPPQVMPPKLSIVTPPLPDGMLTFGYSQTVGATGGIAPFKCRISSGSLPHGFALGSTSSNTTTISGIPDTIQVVTFSVEVSDSKNQIGSQSYTVIIKNLVTAQLQTQGPAPAGIIEIHGLSAGSFNPRGRDTVNLTAGQAYTLVLN